MDDMFIYLLYVMIYVVESMAEDMSELYKMVRKLVHLSETLTALDMVIYGLITAEVMSRDIDEEAHKQIEACEKKLDEIRKKLEQIEHKIVMHLWRLSLA